MDLDDLCDLTLEEAMKNKEFIKCDFYKCDYYGRQRRCYFHIFVNCPDYKPYTEEH